MIQGIGKYSPRKKVENPCKGNVHRYRRFSKKNKTYRTDVYFCADCGNRIKLESIFGSLTRCWNCGKVFNFDFVRLPIFPICENCRKGVKEETVKPETELIDNVLTELGLK
jgi:ribosomal protein L37AE/L43A